MISALLALACVPAPPASDPPAVFDAVWTEMDTHYGNFTLRDVDWDAAYDTYAPQVSAQSTDDELWDVLTTMLAETDDGHVQLARPNHERWSANAVFRDAIGDDRFDLSVIERHYLSSPTGSVERDGFVWGTLPNGAPYVHFAYVHRNWKALDDVVDAHPDARELVVDLRHDSGGDFTWAFQELRSFTADPVPVFQSRTRNGPDRDDFTDWTTWSLEPGGRFREVSIVLLTDRFTISAGERAAAAIQALPGTVTLGEPTNGSLATMIGRELPNRWSFALPVQEVRTADGSGTWEGIGLPVDEEIVNDPADLAEGVDAVLEAAMAAAR